MDTRITHHDSALRRRELPADSATNVAAPNDGPSPSANSGSSQRLVVGRALPLSSNEKTVISKKPPSAIVLPLPPVPTLSDIAKQLVGTRLGHFQIEEFVGGGGMGAVFRATDTMLSRTVAVKVMSRDKTDDDTQRRFQNEAQSAARLDHPNIARVYYVGEDQGLNYIVFEFIEGVNIRDLVDKRGPIALSEAISFTLQVAEALEHAAQRDVVHRDIKPSNVVVMPDGHIKLVDMGLARLHQVETSGADLTASGVTLGTFDYISPEQARDPRSADVRSDLYSLGCTLFFMLTGRPPFPDGTVLQKLLSHTSDPPPDIRVYRPELGDDVCHVLNKLLAKLPAHRYQQPNELIGELLLLADSLGLSNVTQRGKVWVAPIVTRRSAWELHIPWILPVALLFLLVGIMRVLTPESATLATPLAPVYPTQAPALLDGTNQNETGQEKENSSTQKDTTPAKPEGEASKKSPSATSTKELPNEPLPTVNGSTNLKDEAKTSTTPATVPKDSPKRNDDAVRALEPSASSPPNVGEAILKSDSSTALSSDPSRLIVVADANFSAEQDVRVVRTLSEAVRLLSDEESPSIIELRCNGLQFESQQIDLIRKHLTIRAGIGFQPVLTFAASEFDFQSDREMVRVQDSQIEWRGVHFRWEMPNDPADGWALFQVGAGSKLEFYDCLITIKNRSERDGLLQDRVAFFQMQPPMRDAMSKLTDAMMPVRPQAAVMKMTNCFLRGQATLLRASEAVPCDLRLDNSLVLTTDRLIELGGSRDKPTLSDVVQLELRHSTAIAVRGVSFSRTDESAPHPLELVTTFKQSIIATDDDSPLFEQHGTSAWPFDKSPTVVGEASFYPFTRVLWRRCPTGQVADITDITERRQPWFKDESVPGQVLWKKLPTNFQQVDLHEPGEYELLDDAGNKAFGVAGANVVELPLESRDE